MATGGKGEILVKAVALTRRQLVRWETLRYGADKAAVLERRKIWPLSAEPERWLELGLLEPVGWGLAARGGAFLTCQYQLLAPFAVRRRRYRVRRSDHHVAR
jgi:hypothetical protein